MRAEPDSSVSWAVGERAAGLGPQESWQPSPDLRSLERRRQLFPTRHPSQTTSGPRGKQLTARCRGVGGPRTGAVTPQPPRPPAPPPCRLPRALLCPRPLRPRQPLPTAGPGAPRALPARVAGRVRCQPSPGSGQPQEEDVAQACGSPAPQASWRTPGPRASL